MKFDRYRGGFGADHLVTANIDNNTPPLIKFAVGGGGRSKTRIGSAFVVRTAAIVTIANVVMAAVVEPQQSWS